MKERIKKIFTRVKVLFKNRLAVAGFIILVVVLGFAGWRIFGKRQSNAQFQTTPVEKGTIVSSISSSGQILIANIVNITSNASGLVKKVYVKDGDRVTAGQKILELVLDSDAKQRSVSAYSSYLSAKNSLDSAVVTLWTLDSAMWAANRTFINDAVARGLPTYDPTYIQENDNWLAAEAKYKNQQAIIAQTTMALNSAWLSYQSVSPNVAAPMSGVIANITYAEGMTLGGTSDTSQGIAVIRSEGNPLAMFSLSEIDVLNVKPGQKATIKLDSITDKTFTGKVVTVDRIGTVSSGVTSYPAVIRFDTEALEILPNMSAAANIILETKDNVLLVPTSAIQKQGDQSVVRVLRGKQEQTIIVETGLISDTQTEIVSGLSEGEEVIVSSIASTTNTQRGGSSVFGGFSGGGRFIGR